VILSVANILRERDVEKIIKFFLDHAQKTLGMKPEKAYEFIEDGNDLGLATLYLRSRGVPVFYYEDRTSDYDFDKHLPDWNSILLAGKTELWEGHCVAWRRHTKRNDEKRQGILYDSMTLGVSNFSLKKIKDFSKFYVCLLKI
jgi:hypothetical protein